ncbi:hypothetical protein SBRCBS47491_005204 [Sporothrix bragantina]|uniref:Uncharacterized protein n=1 Tax=Sporothrix bragantina TaxID=671064 RepID=A0ABP0BUV6_9PEZI
MKSIYILAQLALASTVSAALCVPSAPKSSTPSSVGSAATYTPTSSSSSDIDNGISSGSSIVSTGGGGGGAGSAATYTPTSGSFTPPSSISRPPPVSSSTTLPTESVSPCGQLIRNPDFALGSQYWSVAQSGRGQLTLPGAAVCGGGVGADGRTACGEFALMTSSDTAASVKATQIISATGAIVSGNPYDIYINYRVVSNALPADPSTEVTIFTQIDSPTSFEHDLTGEAVGGWKFLHYQYTAQGTTMRVAVSLQGTKDTAAPGFDTTIQIGEINVVGCRSGSTSSSALP